LISTGVLMKKKNRGVRKPADSMQRTAETVGDTIIAVLDKLAGKQSDLKLSFEDLTLDTGVMKTRINGAIVLDIVMAKQAST
jgi:hypothetical protein